MRPNDDSDKLYRELAAFMDVGEELFKEGNESRQLGGIFQHNVLAGTQIVPGPADETGEVPLYLVKVPDGESPIPVSLESRNVVGVPTVALAVILMHRLQGNAASDEATPIDAGAARAMAKVLQWLSTREQINSLLNES